MNNRDIEALDILAYFSFIIGLINFKETLSQTDIQNVVKGAVNDIHKHLKEQDDKIDNILDKLGGV